MGGDFVSIVRGVLDGNPMDHGEEPNIFPQTWKKGTRIGAGGSQDRMGGERMGAGGSRGTRIADRSWRPADPIWMANGLIGGAGGRGTD